MSLCRPSRYFKLRSSNFHGAMAVVLQIERDGHFQYVAFEID